jgi:hypothetical protein
MADEEEGSSRGARVLALLEAAATTAPSASAAAAASSGDCWLVYCGAQWHPGCVAAQQHAPALREEGGAAARQRLVYVSSDVDDAGVERAKVNWVTDDVYV